MISLHFSNISKYDMEKLICKFSSVINTAKPAQCKNNSIDSNFES